MERLGIIVGLAAGFLIGYNWPKIKQTVDPIAQRIGDEVSQAVTIGLRYVAEIKEKFEDGRAEAKAREESADATTTAQGPA